MQEYTTTMSSNSKSIQTHKFFHRDIDNDLDLLTADLKDRYEKIKKAEIIGVTPVSEQDMWKQSNSVSTMKWRQYNVFQFHIIGIRKLYDAISEMVTEACDYYNIDKKSQQYMLQGWFNINTAGNGKLGWHDHADSGAPLFHGYYSVSAEPSQTHYRVFDEYKVNENKNNRALLSEMGHPHTMGDWEWEGPRITVAYDIVPLSGLIKNNMHQEQHWVPLY